MPSRDLVPLLEHTEVGYQRDRDHCLLSVPCSLSFTLFDLLSVACSTSETRDVFGETRIDS